MKKQKTVFYETNYSDGRRVRIYENDGAYHSAVYLDESAHFEPVFRYMYTFNAVFDIKPNLRDILLIGGAGYGWPKYVFSTYSDISMDVVDIDPAAFDNALKHFYLDELIEKYHPDITPVTDDGRHFLDTTESMYDVIVNDAFQGTVPVPSLLTREAFVRTKMHLRKNGIYAANLHGYSRLRLSYDLLDTAYTASTVFPFVELVPVQSAFTGNYRINYVLFASDARMNIPGSVPYSTRKCRLRRD